MSAETQFALQSMTRIFPVKYSYRVAHADELIPTSVFQHFQLYRHDINNFHKQ